MNFAKLTDDQVDDLRNMMESRGWDVFKAIIEEEKRVTSEGLYVRMDQRENDLDRGKMRTLRAIISLRDDVQERRCIESVNALKKRRVKA
jgi:hypothetical protein